jgi:hypothetical protein
VNKFKNKAFIFSLLTIIVAIFLINIVNAQHQSANAQTTQTSLQVKVVSLDGTPIKNAKVTVAENMQTADTNTDGYTPVLTVPYIDTPLCKITDGNFSFVNLVVTCDGFKDVILYNCLVYKDRIRQGPVIMMFDSNQTNAPYVAISEVPPAKWTKEFLKQIKDSY